MSPWTHLRRENEVAVRYGERGFENFDCGMSGLIVLAIVVFFFLKIVDDSF